MFDSDHDNLISSKNIELSYLSAELLLIFKPLLSEMENFNETLDKEEFIDSAITLYNTLSVSDKN